MCDTLREMAVNLLSVYVVVTMYFNTIACKLQTHTRGYVHDISALKQ